MVKPSVRARGVDKAALLLLNWAIQISLSSQRGRDFGLLPRCDRPASESESAERTCSEQFG